MVVFINIISLQNLLISWQEFLRDKRKRKDVAEFSLRFMDNILELRSELVNKTYKHGSYYAFKINDPKPRDIHKATVCDRIIHHAIYRVLYPYFDRKFIYDSYSCRNEKGTHKALDRFRDFANIDHQILKDILRRYIKDDGVMWLMGEVIDSFHTKDSSHVGLPLGNVTSQLLVNIYMNEFDQFIKRKLKIRYYIRYADDFIILDTDKFYLDSLIPEISTYLRICLKLSLHSDKVYVKAFTSGVDFLGWIHFPYHRTLRTSTKRRMFKKLKEKTSDETLASYLGMMKHGNTHKLIKRIMEG